MLDQRLTIISIGPNAPERDWNCDRSASRGLLFIESLDALRFALATPARETELDIERVILDHSLNCSEYLDLLAKLPATCNADILYVRADGNGFLSSIGRGGDRVLYALSQSDIRFYLETNDLVTGSGLAAREADPEGKREISGSTARETAMNIA